MLLLLLLQHAARFPFCCSPATGSARKHRRQSCQDLELPQSEPAVGTCCCWLSPIVACLHLVSSAQEAQELADLDKAGCQDLQPPSQTFPQAGSPPEPAAMSMCADDPTAAAASGSAPAGLTDTQMAEQAQRSRQRAKEAAKKARRKQRKQVPPCAPARSPRTGQRVLFRCLPDMGLCMS